MTLAMFDDEDEAEEEEEEGITVVGLGEISQIIEEAELSKKGAPGGDQAAAVGGEKSGEVGAGLEVFILGELAASTSALNGGMPEGGGFIPPSDDGLAIGSNGLDIGEEYIGHNGLWKPGERLVARDEGKVAIELCCGPGGGGRKVA